MTDESKHFLGIDRQRFEAQLTIDEQILLDILYKTMYDGRFQTEAYRLKRRYLYKKLGWDRLGLSPRELCGKLYRCFERLRICSHEYIWRESETMISGYIAGHSLCKTGVDTRDVVFFIGPSLRETLSERLKQNG